MSQAHAEGGPRYARAGAGLAERARRLAWVVLREPFRRRSWAELAYFLASSALAGAGALALGALGLAGLALTAAFVGVLLLAGGLRVARGLGRWQRVLARQVLGEEIGEPEPPAPRPRLVGWARVALTDRAAWRSAGYVVAKLPLTVLGTWFALSIWLEALVDLASPLTGHAGHVGFGVLGSLSGSGPHVVGGPAARLAADAGARVVGGPAAGFPAGAGALAVGLLLLLVAPWPMRLVVHLDRRLMHALLGPDATTSRLRSLERSRSRTLDAATETLQRIERNLHDGTQAQLVALAMRLGQAKEKLDGLGGGPTAAGDLDAVRRLVDEAHRGAKEAIVDLRDLARGIHPPALDTGLGNALSTLAARNPVPTEVSVSLPSRPTPAIEAICYFCAAELLANVAQHAQASRASLSCAQHGPWVRIVVRDDGRGGATAHGAGSSSSGLAGLADRVGAVDGNLSIASPAGGPTVVTVDLPARA